ncbi:hypothetical protein MJ585_08455 [Klebsiella pneumoniae]|nr:hypothetical protein MJ585_08455 [Klebsiella pneumoniae]
MQTVAMTAGGARRAALLVPSEALLARDDNDPDLSVKSAQPLDGDQQPCCWPRAGVASLITVLTLHAVRRGERQHVGGVTKAQDAHYHKSHLRDAFAMQESRRVDPGQQIPPVIEVAGLARWPDDLP